MKKLLSNRSFTILFFLLFFLGFKESKAQDWEMLWSYNISSQAGDYQAGAETDGNFLYTAFWQYGDFAKYDLDGNLIETFAIPGIDRIKDLTFDGEYFYGSNTDNSGEIFIMDFSSQSLIGTITVADTRIRHIAYDSDQDQFWCGNWQSDIICVDRSGNIANTIPFSTHRMTGLFGSAYDNISEGGPYLWVHSQSCFGSDAGIAQISLTSGAPTGVWHNVKEDFESDVFNPTAGGLFSSLELMPGYLVLGGVVQGEPSKIFAYSLMQYGSQPPELVAPENAEFGVEVLPVFQWTAASGSVSYNLQVSTKRNFSEIVFDQTGISALNYQIEEGDRLEETTRYFWRVQGLSAGGEYTAWSKRFSFVTGGDLPQPTLLTPSDGAGGIVANPLISWEKHIAASNYRLQIASDEDFYDLIVDDESLTESKYIPSALEMVTPYWWRVKMFNDFSESDWSETFTFTTGSFFYIGEGTDYNDEWSYPTGYGNWYGGCKQQFLIPSDELFAAGASPGFFTSLGFNVAMINVGTPLQSYEIKLKLTSAEDLDGPWELDDFTSVYFSNAYIPVLGWNVHEFTAPFFWDGASNVLVDVCFNNMSYTYNESCYLSYCDYVATRYFQSDYDPNVCTNPQWANINYMRPNMQFSLEQAAIMPPALEEPANNSVCVITETLLQWGPVEGANSYTLQIAEDPDFYGLVLEEAGITSNDYLVPAALNELSKYYWRVNATDDEVTSFWSQKWNFITEGDLPEPLLIYPSNYEIEQNPTLVLSWEEIVGTQLYTVQLSKDEDFETIYREVFAYSNQITVQNLDLNTQFWWRVQAENECSESPFSEAWTFSTSNVPFAYGYNNWWTENMLPGPVMFALNNPQNMFAIDEQEDYDNVYAGAWAEGIWYAATPWSQEFFSFNLETGERNFIGTLNVELRGISYDEQTSTMYGLSYGSVLYTIDLESAEIELVGELGVTECYGLACSVDGDLYTICPVDDNLYMIDKYTGILTSIGPLGFNAEYEQDLEFDKANNVLYWAGYVDYMGYLFTINVETGAATMVGSFPDYAFVTSLAIPFSPACLAFPALEEPANTSVCNSLSPNFVWGTVENALYYNFELSTNRDFSDIIYSEQELDAPYILLPESVTLDYLTTYYWRVQAFGEDDCISYWSSRWSFVTEGELPQAVLLSPVNGADDCMVSPMFSWLSNPGASFYNLQIAADEGFEGLIVDLPYLTTSHYSGAELSTNTQYWWKVKMTSDCSEGDWSEVFTFTTGSSIIIGEGTYQNEWLGPYNLSEYGSMNHYLVLASELRDAGAIEGALTSLSFNVASIFGDVTAREFTISVKHTTVSDLQGSWDFDNFTTVFGPEDYTPALGWNTHYFENPFIWDGVSNVLIFVCFNNLNEYNNAPMMYCHETNELFFRMHSEMGNPNLCAMDYINWWSGAWMRPNMRFGIDLSGFFPPQLTSPEHKSICNPVVSPLFTWEVVDAESYIFQISSDPDFEILLYQESDIENVEFLLPESVELNNNEIYYWRVRSFGGENVSFWSKTFNFITEGETLPTPTLISPDDGLEDCLSSLNFAWTGHIAASTYHLQIATDENFENLVVDDASLTQASCPIGALALNTQFFWRVMMLSPCSENIWSETRTFTTGSYFLAGDGSQYNGQWDYPAAYSNAEPSSKQQYLILAEELFDSGISEGAFYSIAFNVAIINSGQTLQGYTISLKNTSITEFDYYNDWILSGWNLVYGPVDYTPTVGWNTHEFEEAFVWDGVSNILVDICYNNWNWGSSNESTYWTETPFNSCCYYMGWEDDLVCTDPQWMNVWNMRPNMAFGIGGTGPEQPILIAPSNNAYNVDLTPLLEWSDVEGAVLYNLQIAENSNFYPLVSEQEIFSGTSYQVPTGVLYGASLYYWRVNTSDGENVGRWSNVWKFSTTTPTPILTSPLNGANGVPLVTEFIWEDILPNYTYQIQVAYDPDFVEIVIDERTIESSIVYEFGYNETCYWRVRVNSNGILSDWSEVWTFTTQLEIPWEYDETNVYADIIVPADINPMIGNRPIAEGDAIGLFYEKEPGDWHCAGFGAWDGSNLGIRVWGDDPSTPEKEGYATNETFVFKIWDAVLSREWDAVATYQIGNDFFEPNGFSMLASLIAITFDEMSISLPSGWSIISSYIAPEDTDIEEMFAPIANNLRVMKDAAGQMFDPEFGVNTIGDWVSTSGYLINMSARDVLNITGTQIYPENSPIDLFSGWNLSAYLRDNSISPALALANIENNLFIAKNNDGGLYIPIYGINSLGYMQPGEGYYLYMNDNAVLNYPANSAQKSDLNYITASPKHLIPQCAKSGNNATLLLTIEGKEGNEIGVYNESNMLIGSAVVSNGIAAITVWGKDMFDENSFGAKEAEFISVKLFDEDHNSYKDISLIGIKEVTSNTLDEQIRYKANAIYLAKAAISEDLGYGAFIRNIPNPAASSTLFEFNLPSEGSAEIQIYSSTGELVANFARNQYSAGLHKANFDVSNLASGIYNVVLSFGESRVSSFMIINK